MKRTIWIILGIVVLLFVLPAIFTFASGGRTNPPVERQVNWDSPQTRELFYRACADCHSNETKWPWYSVIPPFSALIVRDVNEGREKFNISRMDMGEDAEEAAEVILEGEMPLPIYTLMHPEARLTDAERQALADGLLRTFGGEMGESEAHEEEDDD